MAVVYPGTVDTFTNPAGTNNLGTPDHAGQHTDHNTAIIAIENVLGTTAGTSVLKNFAQGDFAVKSNNAALGSPAITGGTLSAVAGANLQIGTANIIGGTVKNGFLGTNTYTGGTITSVTLIGAIIGGSLQSNILGTPTIIGGSVAVSGTVTPVTIGASLAPTVVTFADPGAAGSGTINAQAGQVFMMSLGTAAGNRTIGTPNNPTSGQVVTYGFKQNAASTGTLVWTSIYRWSAGTAGTLVLGGTASSWTYQGFRYNATESKWDDMGNVKNIA